MMIAYSLEPPVSEEQFLKRELGISWQHVTADELVRQLDQSSSNKRSLVLVSEPAAYFDILRKAAPNSAIVLLISDERYAPERLQLAQLPAVHRVYRHYGVKPTSAQQVRSAVLGFLTDARGTSVPGRSVFPLLRTGRVNQRRMNAWCEAAVTEVPLGYTNAFAEAFTSSPDISLLNTPATPLSSARTISISFRGNSGLAPRILGMERAEQVPNSRITSVDAAWSANGGRDAAAAYVDELQHSRFALCPPGFANSESFRYYEALICGALPVEITTSVTHLGLAPHRDSTTIRAASWSQALKVAQAMSDAERDDRVERAREHLMRSLSGIRDSLAQDLEG